MKLLTIIGARPQFIKAAVVSRAIIQRGLPANEAGLREILVHTGQHHDYNMSDVFFAEMEIKEPDYNLGISGGSHGSMTGRMLEKVEEVILAEKPDTVLVYGDTNSTLAGALAAAKLHVPVAHVEAGLRSYNQRMPEEINRVLTDQLSRWLFAPTETAMENLRREGLGGAKVHWVGDVMYDAALFYGARAESQAKILDRLGLESGKFILATVHRAENTDDGGRLRAIFEGFSRVARDMPLVVLLHPRTRGALGREGLLAEISRQVRLLEPVGYLDMIMLEKNARLIATDSGGVQKEAFFYRVPCVTLRQETEWVELTELGWNRLVPPESASRVEAGLLAGLVAGGGKNAAPYGNGQAAGKIVEILLAGG